MITDPAFYALAIPAVVLIGIGKGGFGGVASLSVPMLTLVVSAPQAVVIILPILLLADALGLYTFRGKVDKSILRHAVPAGLIGILLGWLVFKHVNTHWLKMILGVEAVIFGGQKLLEGRQAWEGEGQPLNKGRAWFFSMLSGFASFTSHAGAPPMMQFLLPMKLDRVLMVGTLAWYFAIINFSKIVPYAQLGLVSSEGLGTSLVLMPLVPLGYWIGFTMLKKISTQNFLRLTSWLLLLTGIKLVFDATTGLLR